MELINVCTRKMYRRLPKILGERFRVERVFGTMGELFIQFCAGRLCFINAQALGKCSNPPGAFASVKKKRFKESARGATDELFLPVNEKNCYGYCAIPRHSG